MRRSILVVAVLGFGACLGGCAGYLPATTTSQFTSAPESAPARAAPHRTVATKRPATNSESGAGEDLAETMKPFSPEWLAREKATEDRLRRKLAICSC